MILSAYVRAANTRPYGPYFWQLDRDRSRLSKSATQLVLAMPMRLRNRACRSGVQLALRRFQRVRSQARFNWAQIRQMARSLPRHQGSSIPAMALPMRLREGTGSHSLQPNDRNFRILWLHNWYRRKETLDHARTRFEQDVLDLGIHATTMRQPEEQELSQLWRSRNWDLARLAHVRRFPTGHGSDICAWVDARTRRRERQLRSGQLYLAAALGTGEEQTTLFGVETK